MRALFAKVPQHAAFAVHGCLVCGLVGLAYIQESKKPRYYKVTCEKEKHRDLQIRTGWVKDVKAFNKNTECDDGIFFCCESNVCFWLDLDEDAYWIRPVTIPDDAEWVMFPDEYKAKASALVFGPREPIRDWLSRHPKQWNAAVHKNSRNIRFIKNPPTDLVLRAMRRWYSTKQHEIFALVENQTEDMCIQACAMDYRCLQYVKDQTFYVCAVALCKDARAAEFVRKWTPELEEINRSIRR